ncbi:MAG: nitrilase-related carbon-nitrogen hydrolase, partial [Pseudomonadota bacterium]
MKVTVASCQIDVSSASMEKNMAACEEAVKEAVAKGAQICLLPELAVTGYTVACYNRQQAEKALPLVARFEG